MGNYKMIFDFNKEKKFEEEFNCQHYPFLIKYFSRPYSKVNIEEVTDLIQQMKGIDIKLHSLNGGVLTVELKNDKHIFSSNIFLEDMSNSVTKSPGWTLKCESDVLSYGFCNPETKKIKKVFVYEMQPLRRWYLEKRKEYQLYRIPNDGYFTYGRPVPRIDIEQFLIFKVELKD